jgi:hypothetical protein
MENNGGYWTRKMITDQAGVANMPDILVYNMKTKNKWQTGFDVFTAKTISIVLFWVTTSYNLVGSY